MEFIKYNLTKQELFHYTTKENAQKIINDKKINTVDDEFCFFTMSVDDSRKVFFETMKEGTAYIDKDLTVKKREKLFFEDYVILKINVENDDQFFRFVCQTDKFNPYDYAILHRGTLRFNKAEVIPMIDNLQKPSLMKQLPDLKLVSKNKWSRQLKRFAISTWACSLIALNAVPVLAVEQSWLDEGNYSTEWYHSDINTYEISSPQQLAGICYMVKNGDNLQGKYFTLTQDIYLTDYQWVTIPESFAGIIEGAHRLFLKNATPLTEDKNDINKEVQISYNCSQNHMTVNYNVDPTYMVTIPETVTLGDEVEIKAEDVLIPYGSELNVSLTGTNETDDSFCLTTNEGAVLDYSVNMGQKSINVGDTILTVNPSFQSYGNTVLRFNQPQNIRFAGTYQGTVTFSITIDEIK